MATDRVFYSRLYKNKHRLYLLGECEKEFNMSFVIDGTKDSSKINVFSYNGETVKPNTIIYHENTQTWWVVVSDRVERYKNEIDYLYKHELQLNGAIELLNARDLTDCGFYQNRYTIRDMLNRLVELSNFEITTSISITSLINLDMNIDYVKSFENYTLLSAIREVFDAYNCSVKLEFGYSHFIDYTKINSGLVSSSDIVLGRPYILGTTIDPVRYLYDIESFVINVYTNGAITETHTYENKRLQIYVNTITIDDAHFVNQQDTDNGNFVSITFLSKNITEISGALAFGFPYELIIDDYDAITNSTFNIVSKTGDNTIIDESVFSNVKEIKSINKSSYGSVVVSNAENVVSSKAKTYPAVGVVKLSSNDRKINRLNAILRLPSNIFKVNWIQIVRPVRVEFVYSGLVIQYLYEWFRVDDYNEILKKIENIANYFIESTGDATFGYQLLANKENISNSIMLSMRTTLYTGWGYDPINNLIIPPKDNDEWYAPLISVYLYDGITRVETEYYGGLYLTTNKERQTMLYPLGTISYEKGKNYLENFQFVSDSDRSGRHYRFAFVNYGSTDLRISADEPVIYQEAPEQIVRRVILVRIDNTYPETGDIGIRVNYIPMADIKIKYDNSATSNDIKLYNQNGRLTDSTALSKLILSYSKEIESDNITKYAEFFDFDEVPQVGNRVIINNETYVINNVALDFYENEKSPYYIVGEFTLSKSVAVKSSNVNPDTDIRDYGIPQNYNVKRKQLYRDFYELSHIKDTYSDNNYYLFLDKILNVETYYKPYSEHTGIMKLDYAIEVGGNTSAGGNVSSKTTWYYQLDSTTYYLKKAIYEVIEFIDNNIIGYSSMNAFSGFTFQRIFDGSIDNYNTPITYCDDNGNVESFTICMCNVEQLDTIYKTYMNLRNTEYGTSYEKNIMNILCFIPEEIFEGESGNEYGAKDNCDFIIDEPNYNKDAIEVPVFEYSCQIDDSSDVIVGDNILDSDENDMFYVYKVAAVLKNTTDNNNWDYARNTDYEIRLIYGENENYGLVENVVKIEYDDDEIGFVIKDYGHYNLTSRTVNYGTTKTWESLFINYPTSEYDIIIYRLAIKNNYNLLYIDDTTCISNKADLMFVIKNMENANINNNTLKLKINHYKIK